MIWHDMIKPDMFRHMVWPDIIRNDTVNWRNFESLFCCALCQTLNLGKDVTQFSKTHVCECTRSGITHPARQHWCLTILNDCIHMNGRNPVSGILLINFNFTQFSWKWHVCDRTIFCLSKSSFSGQAQFCPPAEWRDMIRHGMAWYEMTWPSKNLRHNTVHCQTN